MSRLSDLVDDVWGSEEGDERRAGRDGELLIPWQVYALDDLRLTVHYFTNALHEVVGLRCDEGPDEVRITVVERRVSNKMPGRHRAQTATLSAALDGRAVVDGATGRRREAFVPDPDVGWAAFDVAVAEWTLTRGRLTWLPIAARDALVDGCRGAALERIAYGGEDVAAGDVAAVYRERGVALPDRRAAAKLAVDAALSVAVEDEDAGETVGFSLEALARSGRMEPDQREQIDPLVALYDDLQRGYETTGEGGDQSDRLVAAARAMHARGGLRP